MLSQSTQNEIAKNQSTLFTVTGMRPTAQPVSANKYGVQNTANVARVPQAVTQTKSAVIMSAASENQSFGQKLNNAIDSVGQELNIMANPGS
jgi:hypothetical protein